METPIGIGSPVNGARSISPFPSIMIPSTGTISPDLISTTSPTLNAWIGTQSCSVEAFSTSEESRASLGNLSNPPCIAFLALTNAISSRCEANATKPVTTRASTYSCIIIAPITAKEIRTWKPRTLFLILDAAFLSIGNPAKEIPITANNNAVLLGIEGNFSIAMTPKINGIVKTAERS